MSPVNPFSRTSTSTYTEMEPSAQDFIRKESTFQRIFSFESPINFSGLKEKYSQFKSFSFSSVRDGIKSFVDWSGRKIGLRDAVSSQLSDLENQSKLPSSITFRKNIGSFFYRMANFGQEAGTYVNYKILLNKLDGYHELRRGNHEEITEALSTLNVLEACAIRLKATAIDDIPAMNDLLQHIQKEGTTLRLKKEMMKEIHEAYTESNETSFERDMDGGTLSKVSFVTYKNGKEGFFKPVSSDNHMSGTVGESMGIPSESSLEASLAQRNVLSYEVSALLPGDLVPKTVLASHEGTVGSFQVTAKGVSLFQEEMKSIPYTEKNASLISLYQCDNDNNRIVIESKFKSLEISAVDDSSLTVQNNRVYRDSKPLEEEEIEKLYESKKIEAQAKFLSSVNTTIDFSQPSLQKAMANAHIFDLLTGQVDRNPGNFFYEQLEDGGYIVHLIDNDQSFPSKFSDFSEKTMARLQECVLTELPRLIDAEMADAISALSEEKLITMSKKRGQTEKEIQATLGRLRGLKKHIQDIRKGEFPGGRIVDTWDEKTFEELQQQRDNYTFRSIKDREGLEEQRKQIEKQLTPLRARSTEY